MNEIEIFFSSTWTQTLNGATFSTTSEKEFHVLCHCRYRRRRRRRRCRRRRRHLCLLLQNHSTYLPLPFQEN